MRNKMVLQLIRFIVNIILTHRVKANTVLVYGILHGNSSSCNNCPHEVSDYKIE